MLKVIKDYIAILSALIKVNESRYKQYVVTLHFSAGENLLKKLRKVSNDTINQ